jgi:hypothetical protein
MCDRELNEIKWLLGRTSACKITTGSARRGAPKLLLGATTFVRGPGLNHVSQTSSRGYGISFKVT